MVVTHTGGGVCLSGEISVYLPKFSLKNVILGRLNCSVPVAPIRIITVLILLAKHREI